MVISDMENDSINLTDLINAFLHASIHMQITSTKK